MLSALLALLLAAPAPVPTAVVALLPLRALGVPPEVARALEATLRNELAALPEATLASDESVLRELKLEPGCEERLACTAQAASRAGARQLIVGTASQLGDAYMVDLKLVDARSGQELRRATHPVSGAQEVLLEALRSAAVELLAPARFTGSLQIQVLGADGALVFVDGKPVGRAPIKGAIAGLLPGQHTVRVVREGAPDRDLFVEVRFGKTTEARVDAAQIEQQAARAPPQEPLALAASGPSRNALTGPALPGEPPARSAALRFGGLGALGLATISATVAIALHTRAFATASELNRREQSNQLTPSDLGSYAQVDLNMRRARAFYGIAAGVGALGAGLLFLDWRLDKAAHVAVGPAQLSLSGRF